MRKFYLLAAFLVVAFPAFAVTLGEIQRMDFSQLTLDGTVITSTGAELNILDGVTSTGAELNILDGVTSTAAELNILDGVTSTAAELNILDGVTATAAEINQSADISANSEIVTTTNTITTAECGHILFVSNGTGFVNTLPAPTAGCTLRFVLSTALTSGNHTIVTASSANVMSGGINELEVDTTEDGPYHAAGDTITFVCAAAGNSSGNTVGDYVIVESDGTNWFLRGQSSFDGGVTVTQAS
jgi:hypothetical protein